LPVLVKQTMVAGGNPFLAYRTRQRMEVRVRPPLKLMKLAELGADARLLGQVGVSL